METFDDIIMNALAKSQDLAFAIIREKCDAAFIDTDSAKIMMEPLDFCPETAAIFSKKTWSLLAEFYCSMIQDTK